MKTFENINIIREFAHRNKRFLYLFDNDIEEFISELTLYSAEKEKLYDETRGSFSTYLNIILLNYCKDLAKLKKESTLELYEDCIIDRDLDIEQDFLKDELKTIILDNISDITYGYYYLGVSQKELAKQYNMDVGNLNRVIKQDIKKLKKILERSGY